ncbi:cell division protein FtsA, partial [Listeria ivanovii FSL F6-596]
SRVREPSFTTAVGLIKYAYQMAELEGRDVSSTASEPHYEDAPKQKQPKQKKSDDEKVSTKMKNFFGAFFE